MPTSTWLLDCFWRVLGTRKTKPWKALPLTKVLQTFCPMKNMNPQKVVYSERIMNYLWASMCNCSLISDINPCESLLWWEWFCCSSAKAWVYALGTKEMLSPGTDSSETHPKARLHIAASLFLFKVTFLGKKKKLCCILTGDSKTRGNGGM